MNYGSQKEQCQVGTVNHYNSSTTMDEIPAIVYFRETGGIQVKGEVHIEIIGYRFLAV